MGEKSDIDFAHEDRVEIPKEDQFYEDARIATEQEHGLKFLSAVRLYPKAVMWSLIISMTIVMEGYDMILITNFFAYPTFQEKYGVPSPSGGYQITGPWQVALSDASAIGTFFGVFLNGWLISRFGHRWVLIGANLFLTAFIFMMFFAPNIGVLFASQLICGLPWGIFATAAPSYAAEVCPEALRLYLTSFTNMCFAIGQLIASGVLEGLVDNPTQWSYRIPFAVQWAFPVPLVILIFFCPDSPWWCVRKGDIARAVKNQQRLLSPKSPATAEQTVALMVRTNELEEKMDISDSWWDCFKKSDLRRTEISCVCFAGQVLAGSAFAYNPTYFFEQAGVSTNDAYKLNVGGYSMAFVGTLCSWFLMRYLGRRFLFVTGMALIVVLLFVIGFLDLARPNSGAMWCQAVFVLLWLFVYSASVGPVGWSIPAEIGSTRLKQKTLCLARNAYYIVNIIGGVIEPYMMNPDEGNWRGKTGFFWGCTALVTCVWAFFRLPEIRGRTYEELDILFHKGVSARKFSKTQIDAYDPSDATIQELHERE